MLFALNFGVFWPTLFIASQRMQGGLASTIGAVQHSDTVALFPRKNPDTIAIVSAVIGMLGVAFIFMEPNAKLDIQGVFATLISVGSMALGIVLTRK